MKQSRKNQYIHRSSESIKRRACADGHVRHEKYYTRVILPKRSRNNLCIS